MITYKSKEDPNLIITSDGVVDPKFKTVFVTYPDGKTKSISVSTLNLHFDRVEQTLETDFAVVKKVPSPLF